MFYSWHFHTIRRGFFFLFFSSEKVLTFLPRAPIYFSNSFFGKRANKSLSEALSIHTPQWLWELGCKSQETQTEVVLHRSVAVVSEETTFDLFFHHLSIFFPPPPSPSLSCTHTISPSFSFSIKKVCSVTFYSLLQLHFLPCWFKLFALKHFLSPFQL